MSETKQTILQIQIDQNSALKDLQNTEKSILNLKEAQKSLNAELKAGKITQDDYVKSKVQLDAQLKQENETRKTLTQTMNAESNSMNAQKVALADLVKERNNLNRETEAGKAQFDDLNKKILGLTESLKASEAAGGTFSRNVGNYTGEFKEFAGEVELAGVSLGAVGAGLTGLLTPALAAAGAITLLGKAYESSAAGGKDLEEAQNVLKAQWDVFAGEVGGEVGESGDGFFTQAAKVPLAMARGFVSAGLSLTGLNSIAKQFDENVKEIEGDEAKAAESLNKLKELSLEQLENEVKSSQVRREALKLTVDRDNAERDIYDRLESARLVTEKLKESQNLQVETLKKQAKEVENYGYLTNNNVKDEKNISELRQRYLQILVAINEAEASRERRISQAANAEHRITEEIKKQQEIKDKENLKSAASGTGLSKGTAQEQADAGLKAIQSARSKDIKDHQAAETAKFETTQKFLDKNKQTVEQSYADQQKEREQDHRNQVFVDNQELRGKEALASGSVALLGTLAEESKAFAIADAIVNTYKGAALAIGTYVEPYGAIVAALTIADGLAQVAKIEGVQLASGGYTPRDSSNSTAVGVVHANEYVVPARMVNSPTYAPIISGLEQARTRGYYDGGMVTNSMTTPMNSQMYLNNTLKSMPQPVVSYREGLIVGDRVSFKEGLTTR